MSKSLKTPAEDSFVKSALKGGGTTTFPLHLSARDVEQRIMNFKSMCCSER